MATANASRIAGATSAALRHQIVVLGDRQRDAGDVGLLKGVGADQLAAHLAGDADDRRRVHHRRGDAGDHVGRAGARGRNRDADAAARARVAVGHVRRALLVADQHVPDRKLEHRVVGRQDRAARVAEDVGHAFAHQAFPQDLCASLSSQLPRKLQTAIAIAELKFQIRNQRYSAMFSYPVTAPVDADDTSWRISPARRSRTAGAARVQACQPLRQLRVADLDVQATIRDVDHDRIAVADGGQRTAAEGFRRRRGRP